MTDIVERLRSAGADGDAQYCWNMCVAAADEIERNRAAIAELVNALKTADALFYGHGLPVDPAITAAITKHTTTTKEGN